MSIVYPFLFCKITCYFIKILANVVQNAFEKCMYFEVDKNHHITIKFLWCVVYQMSLKHDFIIFNDLFISKIVWNKISLADKTNFYGSVDSSYVIIRKVDFNLFFKGFSSEQKRLYTIKNTKTIYKAVIFRCSMRSQLCKCRII